MQCRGDTHPFYLHTRWPHTLSINTFYSYTLPTQAPCWNVFKNILTIHLYHIPSQHTSLPSLPSQHTYLLSLPSHAFHLSGLWIGLCLRLSQSCGAPPPLRSSHIIALSQYILSLHSLNTPSQYSSQYILSIHSLLSIDPLTSILSIHL